MNRHGAIDIAWAGGDHTFRLGLGEIDELEATCEMSIFILYAAMSADIPIARQKHYAETIRLGLVGGGMKPMDARVLVRRYVDERDLSESVAVAEAVLLAGIKRVHSADLEQPSGEVEAPKSSASTSARSMETQP